MQRHKILLVFCVLTARNSVAQTQPLQPTTYFKETYQTVVPVGGHVVMGAVAGSTTDSTRLDDLNLFLPTTLPGTTLCLNIASRDGQYAAQARYEVAGKSSGLYHPTIPSRFKAELMHYSSTTLAVLATVGNLCEWDSRPSSKLDLSTAIIPLSWQPNYSSDQVLLLLNVLGREAEIVGAPPASAHYACAAIPDSTVSKIAFDTECDISHVSSGWTVMNVVRWEFERQLPPIQLKVFKK